MELDELYQIKPGQVALFISKEGINQRTARAVTELFVYFRKLYKDNNVTLTFIPTDNDDLIWKLVGRNSGETGSRYKVVISSWDTVAGFAAEYFGEDIKKIIERVPSMATLSNISISDAEPIIVYLDSNNSSSRTYIGSNEDFDPYEMEVKLAKCPKGSKEEKELISKLDRKLEKVLRDYAVCDLKPDIDRIQKKIKDSLKNKKEYNLSLDIHTIKDEDISFCSLCEIYVAEGEEYRLKLSAVEKAIYLTFLLYEKGLLLAETDGRFRRITQKIYVQLPRDGKCEKTAEGILDSRDVDPVVYLSTLGTYRNGIRNKIYDVIDNPMIAQEFAIEGFRNDKFGIERSTPEIREQIKKAFGL